TVDDGREEQIVERLIQGAVLAVFNHYFSLGELEPIVAQFKSGFAAEVSDMTTSAEYAKLIKGTEGLQAAVEKLGAQATEPLQASAVEFIFEGLHLNKRLTLPGVAPPRHPERDSARSRIQRTFAKGSGVG